MRRRRHLQGVVDIHHVVPRQFRAHPAVRGANYDVGYNLLFCATSRGATTLQLRATRPLHVRHSHVRSHGDSLFQSVFCSSREVTPLVLHVSSKMSLGTLDLKCSQFFFIPYVSRKHTRTVQ